MTRDELIEAVENELYLNQATTMALASLGAHSILMNDGALVPLDGSEAVEGVVVLRKVKAGALVDANRDSVFPFVRGRLVKQFDEYVRIVPQHDDPDGDVDYNNDWFSDETVYVPLNTPSEES